MQNGRRAEVVAGSRAKVILVAVALAVAVADQVTKAWALSALSDGRRVDIAGSVLGLRLVRNSGTAFGLFQGATLLIFLASTLVLIAVVVWGLRSGKGVLRPGEGALRLGLIAGGGAGNLVDRLFRPPGPGRGEVIDFIDLSFWPTFNLADSAIVVGVILLLAGSLLSKENRSTE